METGQLDTILKAHFVDADAGTKAWSSAYHIAFGLSSTLSVLIAVLSGKASQTILYVSSSTLISIMAAIASVLTAIGGFGGFERKWRANRRTRNEIDILMIEVAGGLSEKNAIVRLGTILREHETGVMSDIGRPQAPLSEQPHSRLVGT